MNLTEFSAPYVAYALQVGDGEAPSRCWGLPVRPVYGKRKVPVVKYGGKDSDGDFLYLYVNNEELTYEMNYDIGYPELLSRGTFVMQGNVMKCSDEDTLTNFELVVDGSTVEYDNGEEEEDHYSFVLRRIP